MIAALCLLVGNSFSQDSTPNSSTSLLFSVQSFEPGKPFLMGLEIQLDAGWHCYWQNPGDTGEATQILPKVPEGWEIKPVVWPAPKRLESEGIVSYGYEGKPLFVCEVTPPVGAKSGRLGFEANWLVCSDMCLAASESTLRELAAAKSSKPSGHARKLAAAASTAPSTHPEWTSKAMRVGNQIQLEISGKGLPTIRRSGYFFNAEPGVLDHGAAQTFRIEENRLKMTLNVSSFASKPPQKLAGVLVFDGIRPVLLNVDIKGDQP